MLICPICETEYPRTEEFCLNEGAKLVPIGASNPIKNDEPQEKESDTANTDESVRRQVQQLRAELAQRDAQIANLHQQLTLARGELEKFREAAASIDRPLTNDKAPSRQPIKVGSTKSEGVTLEDTEIVPPPEGTHGWLVCVAGLLAGKRFAIPTIGLKIGRAKKFSEEGGISVADKRVSNPHAWIGMEKDKVVVKDEGSTNGTYVNDPDSERITKVALMPGDSVILADGAAEFVFRN